MRKVFAAVFAVIFILAGSLSAGTAREKYLLNMYHFNIQYVAGSEKSMQRIVRRSFEPLVDFYLAHPGWGADFEMQGMMIEYMGVNYPDVLAKFKKLVNSGQAELVSFHYGDQLLLAFPGHDQDWSLRINDRVMEKHGIRRSGVIFTQEAQFGEGLCKIGKKFGYDVAVMTTSGYKWFQDDKRFPYFTVNGMDVLTTLEAEDPETGIAVKWEFVGDGELVVTGGMSPYFPGLFRQRPMLLKKLEQRLTELEADGYKIATVSEYAGALRAAGKPPAALGAMLDSPWRPDDGSGVFQWMGYYAFPWEKDYDMRTQNWRVRNILVEAERAGAPPETLERAWGAMVNAEVSDPSGWYPLPVEVRWDYEMMDEVMQALDSDPAVDLAAVEESAGSGPSCTGEAADAPFELRLFGNAESGEVRWSRLTDLSGWRLSVSWEGKGGGGVAFPWTGQSVEYSPAMMEDMIRTVQTSEIRGRNIHLALTNGLIGLGGGTWLVRDNAAGCVAAGLDFEKREISFGVVKGREDRYGFRFYVLEDAPPASALVFANKVNRTSP